MQRLINIALLSFLILNSTLSSSAHVQNKMDFYNRWARLSNYELTKKGDMFIDDNAKTDSATVCFSVIANRYDAGNIDKSDMYYYAHAMNALGWLYLCKYYDYSKSYAYLQQALQIAEENNIEKALPAIYLNMGNLFYTDIMIHGEKKQMLNSMGYYKKSFYASVNTKNYKTALSAFSDLLNLAYFTNNVKSINAEINTFKSLKIEKGIQGALFMQQLCNGVQLFGNNDYAASMRCFNSALNSIPQGPDRGRYLLIVLTDKEHLLNVTGKEDEALECVKQKETIAVKYGIRDVLTDVYRVLHSYYQSMGDSAKAVKYELLYLRQKDSLLSYGKLGNVDELKLLYQLKKVNDHVKDLSRKRHEQNIITIASLSVTIIVVVSLLVLLIYYRRLKENHKKLYRRSLEILEKEEAERLLREKYEMQSKQVIDDKGDDTMVEKTKYTNSFMDEEYKEMLVKKIKKVFESSQEIFSDDFTLNRLAVLVKSQYRYVSQVMNEKMGNNFKTILNEYRINEACRRMNNVEKYGNYTIEAISESVGFKSRTYFGAIFKRATGLTPSEYQKLAHKEK